MASIVVAGDTSGTVTLSAPATAGTTTLTLPTTSGTIVVNSGAQTIEFADGSASAPSITNSGDTNTGIFFPAADTTAFAEGGVEAMRIDSGGNLLVGDTVQSGSSKLTLKQSVDATNGGLAFVATDGSGAVISRLTDGGFTFRNGGLERMRITSDGLVNINTTGAISGAGGRLNIVQTSTSADIVQVRNSGTAAGKYWSSPFVDTNHTYFIINGSSVGVRLTDGATAWAAQSDERLKNITGTYTSALSDIAQIKPVKFTWKDDPTNKAQVGVIAQSVLPVVPEAVESIATPKSEDQTEYLSVRYTELIPLMIASIQEQQAIIETLKADIAELKTKVGK